MASEPHGKPSDSPEDALHEQREWLRVTLSSIGDAVITTDTSGRVTFLNPVAESLTGWSLDQASGIPLDTVFKIVNEQTRQVVESPATRALREGTVVGLANHSLLIAKDGTERPIDDSAAPIRNRQGEIAGVVLIFRDISERRSTERAVQDALTYAENIIATLRHPFLVVLDKDLRVVTANRSFYRTFHVASEDTENQLVYELGNRQWDIPALRTLLEDILPTNHAFHDFEVEHVFPSIGRKIMLLNARRIERLNGANGRAELILLAIEDVTERRRAASALQDSEVRYRRLFETARDGILILDADTGKITDSNPYMTEILDYPPAELKDKELWEIGLFRDEESSQNAFQELQERGYIRYDDLPLETKTGKKIEVEFVSNVYQVDSKLVIQCNIRDISERRKLEQTQLQAEALADLHRRKDEFLAMLSHELRNPLAPIMNAVQLLNLQQGNENPIQEQARTVIDRQVGQLKGIIDDLLEVSRITTGRIRLHLENVDFSGIVRCAVESVQTVIDQHRHTLTVSLPAEPIWLHADPTRIEQVVVNLLNNAAKFTEPGGHIWLTIAQEENRAVLRVRDTGVGIAPKLLPRVFELFTQSERSLDRSQGGLGIGLTVVQRLVEMHGGKVEAYSALGQGSEFVVRLPVIPTPASQPSLGSTETTQPTSSLRVLVVDDNVDEVQTLAMLLKVSHHDVRTAHDGPTALDVVTEYQPDVVVLDIGLPGLNGFEVAKRIRRQPTLKNIVLVAMTGYGQESDRERSHQAGFDHHLVKPPDFGELQQILADVSEKRACDFR